MIKFFRKIRYDLMEKNKTGKYLKYAIGEIVLVVIGILLALQINNSNERRKTEILELQYLIRLEKDLSSDIEYFDRRINESETLIKGHYFYIHQAYLEQRNADDFRELVSNIWLNSENFIAQNTTFNELQNAGKMSIIQNQELKDDILSLYKEYEIKSSHIKEYNEVSGSGLQDKSLTFFKYWIPYKGIFDDPTMFSESEWNFINDTSSDKFKHLEMIVAHYSVKHCVFKRYFIDLKSYAERLRNEIGNEVENRR